MPVIRTFLCSVCGAKIENTKDVKGVCKKCGSPYYFEGVESCLKIIKNEEVKSGINFESCADVLHEHIVDFLTSNVAAPLDILENTCISLKRNLCVPAYYYHYNGTSDYLCDVGNLNIKHLSGKDGEIQRVNETSWSTISGNIRAEVQRIASGNKEYDFIIDDFYKPYQDGELPYNETKLVDIESFEIPSNAEIVAFSRPDSELLDRYVRSDMNDALTRSVLRQVGERESRNITLGNSNIERDETIDRLLIALYHVDFTYKETTYSMYASSDGKKFKFENDSPADPSRVAEINELTKAYDSVDSSITKFNMAIIIGIILALIMFICGGGAIVLGIICIIAVVFGFIKKKPLKIKRAELKNKIDFFNQQIINVKNEFVKSDRKLKNSEYLEI